MEDLHARRVGTPHVRRRITPEEGEDGHPLFQAYGDLVLDGEVEKQVHPERPGGEGPQAADLLAEAGGGQNWACRMPSPPALLTAATRSGPVRSGPIGAAM